MNTIQQHPQSFITKCFYAAGIYNVLGSVALSKFLTNDYMASLDPNVFSDMGWTGIFLWGLAYLSIAKSYQHIPYLVLVFFVEKVIYTCLWISWLFKNGDKLPEIYNHDIITGIAFTVYGSGDLVSAVFFLWLALKIFKNK
jgi:uncharacterized membrane protein